MSEKQEEVRIQLIPRSFFEIFCEILLWIRKKFSLLVQSLEIWDGGETLTRIDFLKPSKCWFNWVVQPGSTFLTLVTLQFHQFLRNRSEWTVLMMNSFLTSFTHCNTPSSRLCVPSRSASGVEFSLRLDHCYRTHLALLMSDLLFHEIEFVIIE